MWERQRIQKGETVAARRTVYLGLYQTAYPGKPYATALTEKTIKLSKNGGTQATSTNYIEEIDTTNLPGAYTLVLTAAEVNTLGYVVVCAKVAGTSCYGGTLVQIVDYDPFSEGAASDEDVRARASRS